LKDAFFQGLCDQVFGVDKHIRFIGIATGEGKLLAAKYADEAQNTMTDAQLEQSLAPLVMQAQLYHKVRKIAGKLRYHIGTFERLYSAAIPASIDPKAEVFILMSFELGCDPARIIEDRIIPIIRDNRDYLS
jgi:hypothetical protein